MASIEERVENLLQKKIEELGYKLYDVQYVKEGQNYFLRVYIEKENGSIDLNDCEKEVSSTGVEKVLRKDKHLADNIGVEVEVKLFKPINKQKEFVGILENFNDDEITLKVQENEIKLNRKDISQIKTIYNWDEI